MLEEDLLEPLFQFLLLTAITRRVGLGLELRAEAE